MSEPLPLKRARRYCFVINNYDEAELDSLRTRLSDPTTVRYAIFGLEVGKENTPHVQGYVALKKPLRLKALKAVVSERAHFKVCRGTEAQNIEYCTKDNTGIWSVGKPTVEGKRNELVEIAEAIKDGVTNKADLRDMFPNVTARYPNHVDKLILDNLPKLHVEPHPLRTWQARLCEFLKGPPSDRVVHFYVDLDGDTGKSWFCKYYMQYFGRTIILPPGKKADMLHAFCGLLEPDSKVLFLDCPRSKQGEFIQYDFLEEVKNRLVMTTKYESRVVYPPSMHVIVMMNEHPDMKKLSRDRYDIVEEFN